MYTVRYIRPKAWLCPISCPSNITPTSQHSLPVDHAFSPPWSTPRSIRSHLTTPAFLTSTPPSMEGNTVCTNIKPLKRSEWTTYHRLTTDCVDYILALPEGGDFRATIFLIHGFPDLGFAWRYQIPFLTKLGLRCVAPDMMGYGDTVSLLKLPANRTMHCRNMRFLTPTTGGT